MKPKIKAIHHIALKAYGCDSYDETVRFYRDILGLPIVREWGSGEGRGIMLSTGGGLLEIFASAPNRVEEGVLRHMALAVESTDDCIAAVRDAGYRVTVEPKDIVIPSEPPYPARIAFCVGPLGEEIEFFEEK